MGETVTNTGGAQSHPGCRDCEQAVDHCHGTLIVHAFLAAECTEANCDGPHTFRHSLVVDCVAARCNCGNEAALAV